MELLSQEQRKKLIENGELTALSLAKDADSPNHYPVVKLHTKDERAVWLLSEIYPNSHDMAFCLADLGVGSPEFGDVSLKQLQEISESGLEIVQDLNFKADYPVIVYGRAAWKEKRIVFDDAALKEAAIKESTDN